MHKLKLTALFGGPTLMSSVVTGIGAVVLLAGANFSYLLRSGLIYDLIFGKGTPYDLIQTSRDTVSVINQTVLGNPLLNKLLFFGFWMMVGLVVYAVISTFGQTLAETGEELKSLRYIHARKTQIEQDILLRLSLRITGVLAAFLYGWLFMRLILPFCVFASRVGLGSLSQISGWFYLLLSLVVLLLALHAIVVIARLIVLRPRLYGGWDGL